MRVHVLGKNRRTKLLLTTFFTLCFTLVFSQVWIDTDAKWSFDYWNAGEVGKDVRYLAPGYYTISLVTDKNAISTGFIKE